MLSFHHMLAQRCFICHTDQDHTDHRSCWLCLKLLVFLLCISSQIAGDKRTCSMHLEIVSENGTPMSVKWDVILYTPTETLQSVLYCYFVDLQGKMIIASLHHNLIHPPLQIASIFSLCWHFWQEFCVFQIEMRDGYICCFRNAPISLNFTIQVTKGPINRWTPSIVRSIILMQQQ